MYILVNGRSFDTLGDVALGDTGPLDIELTAVDRQHVPAVAGLLGQAGSRVTSLRLVCDFYGEPARLLGDGALGAVLPAVRRLELHLAALPDDIFAHPTLEELRIRDCGFASAAPVAVGQPGRASPLTMVDISDTALLPSHLEFGAASAIERFACHADQDCAEQPTERFTFRDTARLRELTIWVCGGWTLGLLGALPHLADVSLSSGDYGAFELVNDCDAASSAYARALTGASAQRED
jgi:hypothetical protein